MNIKSIKFITSTLILLLGIVTITIFGYFSFEASKVNLKDRYTHEAELVLKHIKLTFENCFANAEDTLDLFSKMEPLQVTDVSQNDRQVTNLLSILQKAIPDSSSLQFGTESGFVRIYPNMMVHSNYDPEEKNWYIQAKSANGQFIWTEPYLDYMTQKFEFVLHYQPQYCIQDRRIICLEALIRWNSPVSGSVSPLSFIKVAEEIGMIVSIEKWVLKNACLFAKKLNESIHEAIRISVNISSVHIMQGEFIENVCDIIEEVGVNPGLIGLEITETVMMESFESNKNKLEELKKLGIQIHLDDFGSGYSSLNYLQNLPIDYVKIDKAFIDTMLSSERNGRITATIIDLSHYIGLKVVAEGVEYQEQFNLLKEYNCDIIQGYYISRPLPMDDITILLADITRKETRF